MKREEALILWKEVEPKLRSYSKMKVVGSIRRMKPIVKDIDVIVIPTSKDFHQSVRDALDSISANGTLVMRGKYKGISFDFFICAPENWAGSKIWWTGPKSRNISLANTARKKNWIMSNKGLRDRTGKHVAHTEKDIFFVLKGEYIIPESR